MLGHTIGKRLYLQLLKGRREEAGRWTPTLFFCTALPAEVNLKQKMRQSTATKTTFS